MPGNNPEESIQLYWALPNTFQYCSLSAPQEGTHNCTFQVPGFAVTPYIYVGNVGCFGVHTSLMKM